MNIQGIEKAGWEERVVWAVAFPETSSAVFHLFHWIDLSHGHPQLQGRLGKQVLPGAEHIAVPKGN